MSEPTRLARRYEATYRAITEEYGTSLAEEMAAYGQSVPLLILNWPIRSEQIVHEKMDGDPAPAGFICEMVGPARTQGRDDGFKYLTHPFDLDDRALQWMMEIWEARVWMPKHPAAYLSKLWRPGVEHDLVPKGIDEARLNSRQIASLWRGRGVFARLPISKGGRPPRPRTFTPRERDEWASYEAARADIEANGGEMSDADIARLRLKISPRRLRYLHDLRKSFSDA